MEKHLNDGKIAFIMPDIMPQEIAVWYVLPSLRREIAKELIKIPGLNQKRAAEILGVTEAAISQYIKSKRASELKFSPHEKKKISQAAKKIATDEKKMRTILYELSKELMGKKSVCKVHRKHDKSLPKRCKICD